MDYFKMAEESLGAGNSIKKTASGVGWALLAIAREIKKSRELKERLVKHEDDHK